MNKNAPTLVATSFYSDVSFRFTCQVVDRIEAYSKTSHFERVVNFDALLETLYPSPVLLREHGVISRDEGGSLIRSESWLDQIPGPMLPAVHIELDSGGSCIISILDQLLKKNMGEKIAPFIFLHTPSQKESELQGQIQKKGQWRSSLQGLFF